ncbi:hypothetical protein F25303_3673 [Fusarium sp. NRRL 25303]|nr:hypothetical protein F25303_3673 [Fusarium sp. NRRL 25303]
MYLTGTTRLRSTTSSLSLILLLDIDTEAKEACLVRETTLKSALAECKAAAAASSLGSSHSSCAQCGILGKNDPGHFSRRLKTDLAACKAGWGCCWRRDDVPFLRS